jgi:predicted Rossmann fold flavoprotein
MSKRQIVIAGGGAAGMFAAITCAERAPETAVAVLEKGPRFLSKVRISGGGRCNVTHACFDPRELSRYYPRGGKALLGAFQAFQPRHTIEWFESRGVRLKTESDGRMFPVTDSSETIIECLLDAARKAGVKLLANCGIRSATRCSSGGFELELANGERLASDCLMLATGGCRSAAAGELAVALGHTVEAPVPSLFTFHIAEPWVRDLAGISVPAVELAVPELRLHEQGALLLTHSGLSGPAVLRLSAWGARSMHDQGYRVRLRVNWLPHLSEQALVGWLEAQRREQPSRMLINSPLQPVAGRLWEQLVLAAGIGRDTRWASLSGAARHRLVQQLHSTELQVQGKTLNQDEFVTCGGVRLGEVNFKTLESKLCPGLYFGGELLDIDGLTGGFNFQAAWTTGWLAGRAMG